MSDAAWRELAKRPSVLSEYYHMDNERAVVLSYLDNTNVTATTKCVTSILYSGIGYDHVYYIRLTNGTTYMVVFET